VGNRDVIARSGSIAGQAFATRYADIAKPAHQPTQTTMTAGFRTAVSGPATPATITPTRATTPSVDPTDRPVSSHRPARGRRHSWIDATNDRSVANVTSRNDAPMTAPPVRRNSHCGTESDSLADRSEALWAAAVPALARNSTVATRVAPTRRAVRGEAMDGSVPALSL